MIKKNFKPLLLLSLFMLFSSLMVKADENTAKDYLDQALNEKTFYHYNVAYSEIMKVKDENLRNNYMSSLAAIINDVWSEEITYINNLLALVVETSSGKIYSETESYIYKANIKPIDKDYLLGELTSWGKELVWTEEYKVAIEALSNAWINKDKSSIENAQNLINKLSNKYSKDYLNEELLNLKNSLISNSTILKEFTDIKLLNASREEKMLALNSFFNKNKELILPQNYMLSVDGYRLLDYLMESETPENEGELQKNINKSIAKNEGLKFKGAFESNYPSVEINCNIGQTPYEVTDKVIVLIDSLLKDTTYKITKVGKKNTTSSHSSTFLDLANGKISIKPRRILLEQYDTICIETAYKNQSYITEINVKVLAVEENDIIKKLKYLQQDEFLTEDEKLYQLYILLSDQDKIEVPENYILSTEGYSLLRTLMRRVPDTINEIQSLIDSNIAMSEPGKFIAWFAWMKGYPEFKANNGSTPIDITEAVLKLHSPLLKETKVEIKNAGWNYPNRPFAPAKYISIVNERIYLNPRPFNYSDANSGQNYIYESVNIIVTYKDKVSQTNLWVKILP